MKRYIPIRTRKLITLINIHNDLTQIYGELNRIRLVQADPKRAKSIEKFDKENNNYAPFFGSNKAKKKYHADS